MQAKTPRSLLLLSLGALSTAAFAPLLRAAIVMGDSPAVRQAQGALTRGGDVTMDGNTRTGRLATSYAGGDEAERNPLNPGPRDGGLLGVRRLLRRVDLQQRPLLADGIACRRESSDAGRQSGHRHEVAVSGAAPWRP